MTRPLHIRLLFAACLTVLLAAMAAVSFTTLRLDRAQMVAAQQAEVEENVRLALWRMDSVLTAMVVEESARPISAWESFSGRQPALTRGYAPIAPGEVLTPSPLLAYSSSNVNLHFQLDPDGPLTSPQVPLGAERLPAVMNGTTAERIQIAADRLNQFQALLNSPGTAPSAAAAAFPPPAGTPVLKRDVLLIGCAVPGTNAVARITGPGEPAQANPPAAQQAAAGPQARNSAERQAYRNDAEWQARASFSQRIPLQVATNTYNQMTVRPQTPGQRSQSSASHGGGSAPLRSIATNAGARPIRPAVMPTVADFTGEGVFKPMWIGPELVLARPVHFTERLVVQGVWLNWTNLRHSLLAGVRELFPEADLQPVLTGDPDPQARLLAAIPAQLVTGAASLPALPAWSPVRTALTVAWLCVLLAALAVAVLLHGTVSLSERRAAFVSAVTHELRTPLTTFKMYSEMLAEDMVPDAGKRKSYLSTLCAEANRLSHLVENVLAYARLERGSARSRVERISLGRIIERVKARLDQRAAQADMRVVLDSDAAALSTAIHVDASAVEQILFNLVDNACKYAAPTATERIIHLETSLDGSFAMLRVRDHGQGIGAREAKRLFQPFSKSAHDAALSAPGVGLGLALCRRLSRSMGGDLRLEAHAHGGACFVLTLPVTGGGLTPPEATIA